MILRNAIKTILTVAVITAHSTSWGFSFFNRIDHSFPDLGNQQETEAQIGLATFLNQGMKNISVERDTDKNQIVLKFDYPEQRWFFSGDNLSSEAVTIKLFLFTKDSARLGVADTGELLPAAAIQETKTNIKGGQTNQAMGGVQVIGYSSEILPIKPTGNDIRIQINKRLPVKDIGKIQLSFNATARLMKSMAFFESSEAMPSGYCLCFGKKSKILDDEIHVRRNNCFNPNTPPVCRDGKISLYPKKLEGH